ncbi:MAG: hypothetical protein IJ228_00750 [Succinivibrio sp.]|nr:hypothetical protein [Succinivibrio sp.]
MQKMAMTTSSILETPSLFSILAPPLRVIFDLPYSLVEISAQVRSITPQRQFIIAWSPSLRIIKRAAKRQAHATITLCQLVKIKHRTYLQALG